MRIRTSTPTCSFDIRLGVRSARTARPALVGDPDWRRLIGCSIHLCAMTRPAFGRTFGYGPDRLVIINADDLGLCRSPANSAIFRSFGERIATSASLMVPAMGAARGLAPMARTWRHLTLNAEHDLYRLD